MVICEVCGIEFDEYEADEQFRDSDEHSFSVNYDQLGRCLCGECAIAAYANGEYYEECADCGKRFYPEEEYEKFKRAIEFRIIDADMYVNDDPLCADCALKYYDE